MIQLARPNHWVKNVVIFMPVVFGLRMHQMQAWTRAGIAAAAFCFVSAFAYIINDVRDRESDLQHPQKKYRPVACGKISSRTALIEAAVLFLIGAFLAKSLSTILLLILILYVILQLSYTLYLKQKALIDVICIALGFVLRTASGAVAIKVEISPWLFICMFTLCLFMGFCKRYSEVVTLPDEDVARNHRPTLIQYTPELLTHLITLSAGIAVVAFLLYGLSERTVAQFGTNYFIYTLPVAVYAVFRFAMLSMKGAYSGPTELILRDRPFQLTILAWIVLILVLIRFSRNIELWIQSLY